jgi:hypothetical protein
MGQGLAQMAFFLLVGENVSSVFTYHPFKHGVLVGVDALWARDLALYRPLAASNTKVSRYYLPLQFKLKKKPNDDTNVN